MSRVCANLSQKCIKIHGLNASNKITLLIAIYFYLTNEETTTSQICTP